MPSFIRVTDPANIKCRQTANICYAYIGMYVYMYVSVHVDYVGIYNQRIKSMHPPCAKELAHNLRNK